MYHFAYLSVFLYYTVSVTAQGCFLKNRGIDNPQAITGQYPCGNSTSTGNGIQSCCNKGDTCGEDSLCYHPASDGNDGFLVGGCTDSTYKAPQCASHCSKLSSPRCWC